MIEQSVSLASNGVVKVPGYEQLVRFGYTKNRGVYRLAVSATGEWEGLAIRCFWHVPDGKDPASSLVVDGYVDVPASVTAQPGSGCVTFDGSDGTKTVTSADDGNRCIRRRCAVLRALTVHGQAAQGRSESVVNAERVACFTAYEDVLPRLYCADRVTCGFCVSGFALVSEGGVQCYGRAVLSFRALRAGITLFALRPLCTLRATLALNALWALFTTRTGLTLWASGTRSACGALRALLALRADRADGASVALITFLAFEVTACNAVLQLL